MGNRADPRPGWLTTCHDNPSPNRTSRHSRVSRCFAIRSLDIVADRPRNVVTPPQTVRKILARLKYSVLLYKARGRFSILAEE